MKLTGRGGYLLYVVVSLLGIAGIFAFSLSQYRSKAVEQLSKTIEQHRLVALAQSGANEILAAMLREANDPKGYKDPNHFGGMFRAVTNVPDTERPRTKFFTIEKDFPAANLPQTHALIEQTLGGIVAVKGRSQLCINFRVKSGSPQFPSFSGFVDTVVQASSIKDPRNMVEIKERRDVVITYLRDFFDKYVLYVKNYSGDYNRKEQRLVLFGLPSSGGGACSRAYFGNRFPPEWGEFKALSPVQTPIFFDVNQREDKALLPAILEKGMKVNAGAMEGFTTQDSGAAGKSKGKFFWMTSMDFKSIFSRGGFSDADFYSVEALQQQYKATILDSAQKASSGDAITKDILTDWGECGGNYGGSKFFQQFVTTCVNAWKYHFGYTDAESIWDGNTFSDLAKFYHYSGLNAYPDKMLKGKFNPDKFYSGMMPMIFGPDRMQKIIVEGVIFFRFFKIAFFDSFEVPFSIGPIQQNIGIPPIPLEYRAPGEAGGFLNKTVSITGEENCLMSRAVESVPVNSLYFNQLAPLPEGLTEKPEEAFPCLRPMAFSNLYKTPEEFLQDRVTSIGNENVLTIDGFLMIERGDLDLSKITKFVGTGMIWINFQGNVFLGNLKKMRESDTLRIFVQDGDIIVKSPEPNVRIEASLIATRFYEGAGRNPNQMANKGKFVPNKKAVEILGNLVVDHFFLKDTNYGVPSGKALAIFHDPYLFGVNGQDFYHVSVGKVRSAFSISADASQKVIK